MCDGPPCWNSEIIARAWPGSAAPRGRGRSLCGLAVTDFGLGVGPFLLQQPGEAATEPTPRCRSAARKLRRERAREFVMGLGQRKFWGALPSGLAGSRRAFGTRGAAPGWVVSPRWGEETDAFAWRSARSYHN